MTALRHATCFLFILGLCLLSQGFAEAQVQNTTQKAYKLGVQNFDYFPHYNFIDNSNDSYLEELITLFTLKTNIRLEAVPLPTKRLEYAFFENLELDVIYPANSRWYQSKKQDIIYSDTFIVSVAGTMVREPGIPADKIRSVSIPFGFTPVKWIQDERTRQVQIFGVPTANMALQMVAANRTQAADVEFNVAQHLNIMMGHGLVLDPDLPLSFPEFQFASIKHPELIALLNAFLMENKEEIANLKRNLNLRESVD
ncbi:type 2 periplasmic-binding domain-containing protein [Planctobacterium marinum]|uniref:hypothetical protein n=1 Tax=Planctobacterium marinum TaxID=1631968 RepID=UPI001E34928C|nr:hypothetical protein [Planctobacterium marinum]MCC2605439.1 hypothetical protein [Planctobacterium marinum]